MRTIAWVTAAVMISYGGAGCSGNEAPPRAATPTFSPAPGTFTAPQVVTLSCETAGATIHYTLDGSAPTTSSTVYTDPITISSTTTIQALAAMSGLTISDIASGTFTITGTPAAATPTFSPPGGAYTHMQFVTLSSTTPGARIYYTHDGSTPTTSSWLYAVPIEVGYDLVLKAIAVADGLAPSEVAVATYDFLRTDPTATPVFSPPPGAYATPQQVTLSCATPGAMILYTTDGTLPDIYSPVYSGPITISSTTTIRAAAWISGYDVSDLAIGTYTIAVAPATPTFSPPPGTYASPQSVTLSCATPGAWIVYWIVEDDPEWATTYTGPIDVSRTMTIKAYALGAHWEDPWSEVATGKYVIGSGSGT